MEVLDRLERGGCGRDVPLSAEDVEALLRLPLDGEDFYRLLSLSGRLSRGKFGDRGYVFAQIGVNAEPCTKNCAFCSMGQGHYVMESTWRKDEADLLEEVRGLVREGVDDIFLMTTADYPQDRFMEMGRAVRAELPAGMRLVANIGDFSPETARGLREAGFTGAYHICRLREGRDTGVAPAEREATLRAIREAGLELYYCIEPVGPEHGPDELAVEILRARELGVDMMAAMLRIPVPGTPLADKGQISALELTRVVAVTNIVVNPARSMNVHEPIQMPLLAGVNQLYAEAGANPRDVRSRTEEGRGFTPTRAWAMLAEGGWRPAR